MFLKDYRSFFPKNTFYIFLPLYLYFLYWIFSHVFIGQKFGYALPMIVVFSFISSAVSYITLDIVLFYFLGKKTLLEHFKEISTTAKSKFNKEMANETKEDEEWNRLRQKQDRDENTKNHRTQLFTKKTAKKVLLALFYLYILWFLYLNKHSIGL